MAEKINGNRGNAGMGKFILKTVAIVVVGAVLFLLASPILSGISGHADRRGLQQWLKGFAHKPRAVFVNHGDDGAVTAFTDLLRKHGYTAYAPHSGTVYDLLAGKFQKITRGVPIRRAAAVHAALVCAAEDLLALVKRGKPASQKEQQALADRIRALIKPYQK